METENSIGMMKHFQLFQQPQKPSYSQCTGSGTLKKCKIKFLANTWIFMWVKWIFVNLQSFWEFDKKILTQDPSTPSSPETLLHILLYCWYSQKIISEKYPLISLFQKHFLRVCQAGNIYYKLLSHQKLF